MRPGGDFLINVYGNQRVMGRKSEIIPYGNFGEVHVVFSQTFVGNNFQGIAMRLFWETPDSSKITI